MDHTGDFSFVIDFKKGEGNPRRVFDAASALIDAFQAFDKAILPSIGPKIETAIVLEEVEAGSMKAVFRTFLKKVDDEALRSGDIKKVIGTFLIEAKYATLRYLDDEQGAKENITPLKDELQALAQRTDARHLPDYAPVHEGRLIAAMDKVQKAKAELETGDEMVIDLGPREYRVDISQTWLPSETLEEVPQGPIEKENFSEVFLTIRKPDLIKNTMWQFSHGKATVNASIKDEDWLRRLHDREIGIYAQDALHCTMRTVYTYDENGELIDTKSEIIKVHEIKPAHYTQDELPL